MSRSAATIRNPCNKKPGGRPGQKSPLKGRSARGALDAPRIRRSRHKITARAVDGASFPAHNAGMDAVAVIHAEIERRKQKVAEIKHALELAEAELRAAEAIGQAVRQAAAKSAAAPAHLHTPVVNGDGRGRRPGVISNEWRQILRQMLARFPAGATAREVAEIGRTLGRPKLAPNKAEVRMTDYVRHGFVEVDGNGNRFRVTEKAIDDLQLRSPDSDHPAVQ
jgi:hypothetical protein